MANVTRVVYEFGPYRLDPAKRSLVRDGQQVALAPKTFDLLCLLVERRDQVFAKKDLMDLLWPGTFVEEANLSFQVSALRKVFGNNGGRWIENLPRYGYRFAAEVTEISPDSGLGVEALAPVDPRSDSEVEAYAIPSTPPRAPSRFKWPYAIPVFLLGVIAAVLAATGVRESTGPLRTLRFQISPPEQVRIWDLDSLALSPDGEKLVFIGLGSNTQRQLWLRPLNSLTANRLAGTELVDAAFWSPDSKSLAFFSGGSLKALHLESGKIRTICSSIVGRSSGTWSHDGIILFESAKRREIYRVPAEGGEPVPIRLPDKTNHEIRYAGPQFLADGRHYIYFVQSERQESTGIYVASLDSKDSKQLLNSFTNAALARLDDGATYLLYTKGSQLLAQSFDTNRLEMTGRPISIVPNVSIETTLGIARASVSASQNGILAYRTQSPEDSSELRWFDRQGRPLGLIGAPGSYTNPALSPDERKLIVSRTDPQIQTRDLWLFDLATGASSRFTFDPDDEDFALWSKDGSRIAYNVVHDGIAHIFEKPIAGDVQPELFMPLKDQFGDYETIRSWSPDGRFFLFGRGLNVKDVWALRMDDHKILGPYNIGSPRVSPNGKWVAFTSEESGQSEVYVEGFPKAEGKWQVSTQGGAEPSWRADGRELFFLGGNKLYGMNVDTQTQAFKPGIAKPLFDVHVETFRRRRYQVAANGERFLIVVPSRPSPITVETNWVVRTAQ